MNAVQKEIKLYYKKPCDGGLYDAMQLGWEMERVLDGGQSILPGSELHQELTRVLDQASLTVIVKIHGDERGVGQRSKPGVP